MCLPGCQVVITRIILLICRFSRTISLPHLSLSQGYSSSARLLLPTDQPTQQVPLEHLSGCLFILVAPYFSFTQAPPYLGRAAQGW